MAAAAAMLTLVFNFAQIGVLPGVAFNLTIALGTALAPFVPRVERLGRPYSGYLVALLVGAVNLVFGLTMLLLPDQYRVPVYDAARPYLPLYGGAFLLSGTALALVQFRPSLPTPLVQAVHLAVLVPCFAWAVAVSIPATAWLGILYFCGFAPLVASLPWSGPRLRAADARSFSFPLGFALALAAALPLVVATAVVTGDQERHGRAGAESGKQELASALASDVANYIGSYLYLDGSVIPFEQWPVNRLLAGRSYTDEEYLVERGDGSRRRVLASGSAVYDDQGRVVLALSIARDITELRQLEEVREDFVRAVSHDLRQPLTVIQGQAQLLKQTLEREGLDERKRRILDGMVASSKRMGQMIADMVEATRLETRQVKLERVPIDLNSFALDFVSRLQVASSGARVQVEVPDFLPLVNADADRLERVLGNLVGNALQYSPADAPVVISFAYDGGAVVTSVRDWGRGIPAQDLPHLFERYFRSRELRETKSEGLGLGLYISRLIVEAHGGTIWVESEVNRGSTFSFVLPLAST